MNGLHDISRLVDRFFDGDTTPAEEREIYAFFASHRDLGDLEQYRSMFGWYASLPQDGRGRRSSRRRNVWWVAAGIAATMALAVGIGFSLLSPRMGVDRELYSQYQGSYVVCNGKRITDLSVIYPSIVRAEATADSINDVIAGYDCDIEMRIVDEALSAISDTAVAAQVRYEILGDI